MKEVNSELIINVPRDIKVQISSRIVTVTGKYGKLVKDFKHAPVDLKLINFGRQIKCEMWFSNTKPRSTIRTVCSHINNMFTGLTKKYQYKLRMVYAHFPINANITNGGKTVEIRNFLGEKVVRTIDMLDGCTIRTSDTKDELVIEGTSIENVSRGAALIHQSCLVKEKDIRKFLDGIYVSSTGVVDQD
jgi:large subunit ribosomal protein L9e